MNINIALQADCHSFDAHCHRPDLSLWRSTEEGEALVVLTVKPMWGASQRFVELTPEKAIILAGHLIALARQIEQEG